MEKLWSKLEFLFDQFDIDIMELNHIITWYLFIRIQYIIYNICISKLLIPFVPLSCRTDLTVWICFFENCCFLFFSKVGTLSAKRFLIAFCFTLFERNIDLWEEGWNGNRRSKTIGRLFAPSHNKIEIFVNDHC